MILSPTPVDGAFLVDVSPKYDGRGFFVVMWSEAEATLHGLNPRVAQIASSFNARRATLRGLHFQSSPHAQAKLVRCVQGRVYDVGVDLRPTSPTYRRWFGVELSASNRRMVYVPEGLAHGYLSLEDESEVFYSVSDLWHAECEGGIRWDDPAFEIEWPLEPLLISPRDRSFPDFKDPVTLAS